MLHRGRLSTWLIGAIFLAALVTYLLVSPTVVPAQQGTSTNAASVAPAPAPGIPRKATASTGRATPSRSTPAATTGTTSSASTGAPGAGTTAAETGLARPSPSGTGSSPYRNRSSPSRTGSTSPPPTGP
jgi:hypothetical protein